MPPKTSRLVTQPAGFALFNLGFRPFFLAAGLAALALITVWGLGYVAGRPTVHFYAGINWHAHEMVFGYTSAVIAGFLLTAVRNWTGLVTLRGPSLALMLLLWLIARVFALIPAQIPAPLIALVDVAFLPLLGVAIAIPLVRKRQLHNLVLIGVIALLALMNLLAHLQVLGMLVPSDFPTIDLAVILVMLIITIIGGRVIPSFTESALTGTRCRCWPVTERLAVYSVVAYAVCVAFTSPAALTGTVAAVAALAHGMRLYGWYTRRVWSVPLLWILHCGYGWLVTGFALKVVSSVGWLSPSLATHAFTAGTIGALTLGMMARVALGHTGRPLHVAPVITVAFVLVNVAAFVRVLGPVFLPKWYAALIGVASGFWVAAFVIFLVIYTPILLRPRIDGRSG